MSNPILDAARARLTAITAERSALDREERELRAMVAAAEGASAQPVPALPLWPPTINPSPSLPWSPFVPAPNPLVPWVVAAPHGGLCACPLCVSRITCGEGWTSATTQALTLYVGDVNPNAGSVIASGTATDILVLRN